MSGPGDAIRALVVDDEPLAREGLRVLLARDPDVEVVGECGDGESAAEAIETLRPDLVFLDIQMPEADGFAALSEVEDELPLVIFVTAYDEHAIRAFEVHALDYLLKPFDDERFEEALGRAKKRLREQRDTVIAERIEALLADRSAERGRATARRAGGETPGNEMPGDEMSGDAPPGAERRSGDDGEGYLDRLVVKRAGRVLFLDVADIDWIEAADYYVRLHAGEESHLLRTTMKRMERSLDPAVFFRIHRSFIVRLDYVRELRPDASGEYSVVLRDGTELSLSRSRRKRLEERLGQRL